jgi:hypothetical protein
MRDYYCYVYYDENWVAYYVGKGCRNRKRVTRQLQIPPNERIQTFHFTNEWEAYECEIDLIHFWGRKQDGGSLENVALGGPGAPGVIPSEETRAKRSKALKGRVFTPEWKEKLSAAAKGRSCPQVTRDAASRAHKGKPKSPEHRAKIAAALKGNTNGAKSK